MNILLTIPLMELKGRNRVLLSFLCFILLMGNSCSQTDRLLQGRQLKDGDELLSAFGKFKLGFFSPQDLTNRYLGVWYNRPKDAMLMYEEDYYEPVWVANRNRPISDHSGCLKIDSSDGNLKILHSGGSPIAISSVHGSRNTSVTLLQSGNLVLHETSLNGSIKRVLWQSFDYPTDTLLPGMKLGINLQTGHKWFLQSWLTDSSPAQGSFTLGMNPVVSNQLIIWWHGKMCRTSGIWLNGDFNYSDSWGVNNYNFSYTSNEQETYFSYSTNEDSTSFPILTIDSDGSLTYDGGDMSYGVCPIFENKMAPVCRKSVLDFNFKYGFMSGDGFKFKEGNNKTSIDCEIKCQNNCSCFAYATTNRENDTGCEIWSRGTKFIEAHKGNYRQIYMEVEPKEKKQWIRLIVSGVGALLAILLCSLSYLSRRKHKEENWWMSLTVAIGIALVIPLFCYLCYLAWRKIKDKVESIMNRRKLLQELGDNFSFPTTNNKDHNTNHDLKIFNFQTIVAATHNFASANKLGEGGFGPVYKGELLDGREIAIKRLSKRSGQGIVEFKNEAILIAKLQHTNLVRLLGCSLQREERILVYEYMPNKSLDFFIFNSERKKQLNWKKHFTIIEGIAQGLLYLHKYSRLRVIHLDLKAGNILLDNQMNPKISDFGMARIFGVNELEAYMNRVVGTFGYMSPEYAMNGIVSTKTDVFSFGVLVLEIVSGRKNTSCYHIEHPLNLVGYAWQQWNEGKGLEIIDLTMDESCSSNEVLRCIHVGLLCVQDQAADRPTMSNVVSMLTSDTSHTIHLPAPKQPAFFINGNSEELEAPEIKLENCSINDVTISDIDGR